jgi:hypothetical protein
MGDGGDVQEEDDEDEHDDEQQDEAEVEERHDDQVVDEVGLPGDSAEQRAAEAVMLEALGHDLGVALVKQRLTSVEGAWVEIDGIAADPPTLVEAWAHQGPPKPAQKAKVMTDALKLIWAEAAFYPAGARKVLLFSDEAAAARFRPGGGAWAAAALAHFGVEVRVVALPEEARAAVRRAQERQFR